MVKQTWRDEGTAAQPLAPAAAWVGQLFEHRLQALDREYPPAYHECQDDGDDGRDVVERAADHEQNLPRVRVDTIIGHACMRASDR